ncbi:TorF family putative porin [Sulfurovum sp.]|uniref:TorF family putative porin n=1 Tax=Sulfurovum sp. TaxID=1969726 RepID=UPI0028682ACA|nr:TorF family putative porin [Sulfurovum sp.]
MKLTKLSLVALLAINTAFAGGNFGTKAVEPAVDAVAEIPTVEESPLEISANLAIASNYVWRGMTQSHNSPAVQGGLDLGYNGFYLGTWGSNVDFGDTNNNLEADFYAGYAGEVNGFGYDLGYIYYAYPNESDAFNFDEAYVGVSYDFDIVAVNGKYSFGLDSENDTTDYWEVGASAGLPMDMTLAASYGDYDEVGTNYLVSLAKTFGKFEITVAYTDFDAETGGKDEDHIIGTISTSF